LLVIRRNREENAWLVLRLESAPPTRVAERRAIRLSARAKALRRLYALAVLSVGLLLVPGAAQATANARVVAWGCFGEVAHGQCTVPAAATSGVTAISAGAFHSLALKSDGGVLAWGCGLDRNAGQCTVPAAATSGVTAIAAGSFHSLALKADGSVVAWGCDVSANWGQCAVPAAATSGVTAIAAGDAQSLALKADGSVVAWGCAVNAAGQCTVPAAATSGVTAIAAGSYHSLALKTDGSVVAWGCGGQGDYGQCTVPVGASGVTAIAAGGSHSLALKTDGSVVAWGCGSNGPFSNDWGQCTVPAAASGVSAIAAGLYHSLVLTDGGVVAFGCRGGAAAGVCNVPATATSGVTAIATADLHSLALSDPLAQTIDVSVHAPATATFMQSFAVSASSTSGLPVVYGSSGACSNSGATFTMTSGTGTCFVRYDRPGRGAYGAAPQVLDVVAAQKARQSITFGPLANKTYGVPDFRVSATASSGYAVIFAAHGSCRISRETVHLTGAGSCTVTASQPGDREYDAAPAVSRTFSIAPAPCRVPKVVGKPVASAKRTIVERHCRTGKVSYAYSRKRKKGVVISQSRRPGRVLPARSKINLIVSRGRTR
jgi:Regulator of chromosome condensation (RCC1) repeat/PASTA domain